MKTYHSAGCIFFGVLVFVLFAGALPAEVIYLHNGEILIGDIVGQTRGSITIKTDKGVRTVSKGRISKTAFNPGEEARARAILKRREEAKKRRAEERKRRAAERRRRAEAERRLQEAETLKRREYPSSYYVFRSITLPGLGHIERGQRLKGGMYMALTGLALGYTASSRVAAEAAEETYNRGVIEHMLLGLAPGGADQNTRLMLGVYLNSNVFQLFQESVDRYNASLGYLAGVYVLQILHTAYDAYFGSEETTRRESYAPRFRFALVTYPEDGRPVLAGMAGVQFYY